MKKVPIKVVLTETERKKQRERLHQKQRQTETEKEQLYFEQKKMERKHGTLPPKFEEKMTQEIKKRENKIEALTYQAEQLNLLPDGYELVIDEVESVVEVKEGMSWEAMKDREIIIEDGVIKRVRDV